MKKKLITERAVTGELFEILILLRAPVTMNARLSDDEQEINALARGKIG